ncbi:hypothetical protein L1987_48510 [Smallanthus sonchifolius]|uniref:Uncharacterized protein n=1 Tax=Smallanthus sonchifolius TaxID=185202 RepID=A0ACB9FS61_9ASTR|nr:hypothetical protein L1987_48510 [Smallanthus sonchifolius]
MRNSQVPYISTSGIGYNAAPHPFNYKFTDIPQEDEVTSYASCTSCAASSVSDSEVSESESVGKGKENCILIEPDEDLVVESKVQNMKPQFPKGFKKVKFVKVGNMQQEVSKIEMISNKDFIENKIFEETDVYEQECADPFFKKKFVKRSQQYDVNGKVQVQEIVDPVLPNQPEHEAMNDDNIQDVPIQDPMIQDSPREEEVADTSDSEGLESESDDPDATRIPVDRRPQPVSFASKRVKMVARKKRKKTTGPPPESYSKGRSLDDDDADYNHDEDLDPLVTKAKKQRVSRPKFVTKPSRVLVQEGVDLLNTIFSQAATTATLVQDYVSIPPGPTTTSTQVTPDTQRLLDGLISTPLVGTSSSTSVTIMVAQSNVSPPKSRRTTRSTSTLRDESEDHTNMLAAQRESSCRQETLIIPEDEYDDTEGAHGRDEQPIASSMPKIVDKETLECLIDLDNVMIDDLESDVEDVEIELEQDDEVVKYANHEGIEFDKSFIDQINQLSRDNAEEGEIIEEIEKENDSIEKSCDPFVISNMTWAEKKKA